ncbi:carboxymuconolactone decarboxylase family protein [Nocardia australiensis]|uniref:carboxymuconolactone decarboxylase family protein n=1 Tax=Nocardia australiensis TaxID=2887191 RepID=UPI001D15599C|nr:carboxymuconolactone decarboxylase family protein [Nocardia australiensis]
MRAITRTRHYVQAIRQTRRHRMDLVGWLARRPLLLLGSVGYETAMLLSNRLEPKLKDLAELKAAGMVSCEFCLDIGSVLARASGLTESQITDLPRYATSDAYNELEKLVIAFAEGMTTTPVVGTELEELRTRLLVHLSEAQVAELAATVAWENQRARVNQALGVRPTGMSDGMTCALPERPVG